MALYGLLPRHAKGSCCLRFAGCPSSPVSMCSMCACVAVCLCVAVCSVRACVCSAWAAKCCLCVCLLAFHTLFWMSAVRIYGSATSSCPPPPLRPPCTMALCHPPPPCAPLAPWLCATPPPPPPPLRRPNSAEFCRNVGLSVCQHVGLLGAPGNTGAKRGGASASRICFSGVSVLCVFFWRVGKSRYCVFAVWWSGVGSTVFRRD